MAASQTDIRRWLERGKTEGATHVIVVCDTFDWSDYPVYVTPGQDPREVAGKYSGKDMQKIMEVYALHLDLDTQLNEHRAFHYAPPSGSAPTEPGEN